MNLENAFNAYHDYLDRSAIDPARAKYAWAHITRYVRPGAISDAGKLVERYTRSALADHVSPGTINRNIGVLAAALNWCHANDLCDAPPKLKRLKEPDPKVHVLTDAQIKALRKAAEPYPHLSTFIDLALISGQRKSAILALKWDQVDLDAGVIDFSAGQKPRMKGRGVVALGQETCGKLRFLQSGRTTTPYVIQYQGRRVRSIEKSWHKAREAAGLPRYVTPHVLRHTVATRLADHGVPIERVSLLLGHARVETTWRIYVTKNPHMTRQGAEIMEAVL